MITYKMLLCKGRLWPGELIKKKYFSLYSSPQVKHFFDLEGNRSKDLHICSILFCLLTWNSLRWVLFWVVTLCFACVFFFFFSWHGPKEVECHSSNTWEALELPKPGVVRSKWNGKGTVCISLVYLLLE